MEFSEDSGVEEFWWKNILIRKIDLKALITKQVTTLR